MQGVAPVDHGQQIDEVRTHVEDMQVCIASLESKVDTRLQRLEDMITDLFSGRARSKSAATEEDVTLPDEERTVTGAEEEGCILPSPDFVALLLSDDGNDGKGSTAVQSVDAVQGEQDDLLARTEALQENRTTNPSSAQKALDRAMKSLETVVPDDVLNTSMVDEDVYAIGDGLAATQPAEDAQPTSEEPMFLAKVTDSAPSCLPHLHTYPSQHALHISWYSHVYELAGCS